MNLKLVLPESERPRERCLEHGAGCLSLKECLALVLGSGNPRSGSSLEAAARLLGRSTGNSASLPAAEEARSFFETLETSPNSLLVDQPGLGDAQRARLLAVFEIARRYAAHRSRRLRAAEPGAASPSAAASSLARIGGAARSEAREWLGFVPMYATGAGELCIVERGVRTHVNTEPAELFARVLALRPRGFVLAHNHPSGDPSPSRADLRLTEQVYELANRLGIPLLGHWVLTAETESWIDCPAL